MFLAKVEGTLVATARIGGLQNRRLLVVKERGSSGKQVAVDPVGCKPGDWVIAVGSSAARDAAGKTLGTIAAVHDYGGGPSLEISPGALIVPFTKRAVPVVDVAAGHVVVEPPAETVAQP